MVSVRESRRKHIRSDDSRLTVEGLLEGTERPRYLDLMQGGLPLQKSKPEIVGVQLNFDSILTDSVEVKITEEIKGAARSCAHHVARSEEHTSELQSRLHLV